MANFDSLPVINNPLRRLGLHPDLVEKLSPPALERVIEVAGKTLLSLFHPSRVSESLKGGDFERDLQAKRSLVQSALEELRIPEAARKAVKEYRGLSLQGEVDKVAEYVAQQQEFLQALKRVYSEFLTERVLLPADQNISKVRNANFKVLDVISLANFGSRIKPRFQELFERDIRIDESGYVVGGVSPFFKDEPQKRVVAVLRIDGEDLPLRLLEKVLRQTQLTVPPSDRSLMDRSKGEPIIQPWNEFSPILDRRGISKLTFMELRDSVAKLSVRYAPSSESHHSYLISASRIPEQHIVRLPGQQTNRDFFYIEGLIRSFSTDNASTSSDVTARKPKSASRSPKKSGMSSRDKRARASAGDE